jgi:hypothetical protein
LPKLQSFGLAIKLIQDGSGGGYHIIVSYSPIRSD